MTIKAAIESLNSLNAFHLANMAEVSCPDDLESPGAEFLVNVRNAVVERLETELEATSAEELEDLAYSNFADALRDGDMDHEIADDAPSIYNHRRMQELVDLAAYDEDVSDYGRPEDVITAAGWALYIVAQRLVSALLDYVSEYDEEA